MKVFVKKINELAKLPVYKHEGDSCADITSTEDVVLLAKGSALVCTGLQLELPEGYECQVRARSGLAFRNGISVLNGIGTIDNCYRGEIKVILFNNFDKEFKINVGDRIAQIAIVPVSQAAFVEVGYTKDTNRGDSGFGSTGVQ